MEPESSLPALARAPLAAAVAEPAGEKAQKKKKKVRSVWISFVGRIVAQFVGSAATIVLGLFLLQKYHSAATAEAPEPAPAAEQRVLTPASLPHEHSIAVLPLLNFSRDPANQYVADSMTEVLTTALAQVPGLHVISRTSATNSKGQDGSLTAVAESLRVRYIVEGSVAEANGRVRVTAQLIDATRDQHLWARQYDRPATRDLLRTQDEIAAAIVRDLNTALMEDGAPVPTSGSTEEAGPQRGADRSLRLVRRER